VEGFFAEFGKVASDAVMVVGDEVVGEFGDGGATLKQIDTWSARLCCHVLVDQRTERLFMFSLKCFKVTSVLEELDSRLFYGCEGKKLFDYHPVVLFSMV
jgi:hypothetical protein